MAIRFFCSCSLLVCLFRNQTRHARFYTSPQFTCFFIVLLIVYSARQNPGTTYRVLVSSGSKWTFFIYHFILGEMTYHVEVLSEREHHNSRFYELHNKDVSQFKTTNLISIHNYRLRFLPVSLILILELKMLN